MILKKTAEGSTSRLIQLCIGYFFFYVVTGVAVKYFMGSADAGYPGMKGMEYLVYSTIGGTLICLAVVLALGWYRIKSVHRVQVGRFSFPSELMYIIPSGICTAVVIPTTTLMYTLPISVMVAMLIMRGSIIVISRIVDSIQIQQGVLKKTVYFEENIAVVFAVLAVSIHLFGANTSGGFDFIRNPIALTIFMSYIAAYTIRIYIMNYYKNTRPAGSQSDNKGFFGVEQISASMTLFLVTLFLFNSPVLLGWNAEQIHLIRGALISPLPHWEAAVISGLAYGAVAFFSVFIFMFKGRTATFAGLVNRLTSLLAGTAATLVSYFFLGGKFPILQDWVSMAFILVAVAFLTEAEKKRTVELRATESLAGRKIVIQDEILPGLVASHEFRDESSERVRKDLS